MKIRNGYVTNSSSSSFLLSTKKDWGKDIFLSTIGVDGVSPMNQIFEGLFEAIDSQKVEIHRAVEEINKTGELPETVSTVPELLEQTGFDAETIAVVEQLIAAGRTVYYGKLYTASDIASEAYFCCRSFVICEDDIYLNHIRV